MSNKESGVDKTEQKQNHQNEATSSSSTQHDTSVEENDGYQAFLSFYNHNTDTSFLCNNLIGVK